MFNFFKKKVGLRDLSKLTTNDIKSLTESMDAKECSEILRKTSHQGSLDCQLFLSTACIQSCIKALLTLILQKWKKTSLDTLKWQQDKVIKTPLKQ